MYKAAIEIAARQSKSFEIMTDPKRAHVDATVQEYGRRFDVHLLVASMKRNDGSATPDYLGQEFIPQAGL